MRHELGVLIEVVEGYGKMDILGLVKGWVKVYKERIENLHYLFSSMPLGSIKQYGNMYGRVHSHSPCLFIGRSVQVKHSSPHPAPSPDPVTMVPALATFCLTIILGAVGSTSPANLDGPGRDEDSC